ncbi:Trypomastigote, Alanine, Serine and Valine rich protein (TASV), subfamily A [Trypanosoma cruzi]|uniref:Trypomastigote, Alanine, Serine and Valine rich protein (TASV), subfamily A n=1 Tax=Trypanosoma cruzi TaxID=5693 RepID=A0A2V2WMD4_TRYCR|nr:Trypomastigote, Alanine, Serine and Valine rich protein (TASV), subfamily A [Trypanosoma cruzi]
MMMMSTVRRRVACFLLVLALLCSSNSWCSSALAREVYVPVEVACGLNNGNLRWRLPSGSTWFECVHTEELFVPGMGMSGESEIIFSFCLVAHSLYMGAECSKSCDAASSESAAFTMSVSIEDETAISTKWKQETKTVDFSHEEGDVNARSGICSLRALLGDKADGNRGMSDNTAETQLPKKTTPKQPPPATRETEIQKEIDVATNAGKKNLTKARDAPKKTEKTAQLTKITTNGTAKKKKHMKIKADFSESTVWLRMPLLLLVTVLVCAAVR